VRDVAAVLNLDERIDAYVVESENFESIHNHSAYALIEKEQTRALAARRVFWSPTGKFAPGRARLVRVDACTPKPARDRPARCRRRARGLAKVERIAVPRGSAPRLATIRCRSAAARPSPSPHRRASRILELKAARRSRVGTGSGYQAAVLAEIAPAVYDRAHRVPGQRGAQRLEELGYGNIEVRSATATRLAGEAPFDGIVVTAAAPQRAGGAGRAAQARRPDGDPGGGTGEIQYLKVLEKRPDGYGKTTSESCPCAFVPLVPEQVVHSSR
jgi:hypothetical protein